MLTHLENETALVAEAQAGDADAFGRLLSQYERHVYRVALRITHDPQDAEEAIQDAFLKVYTHLGEFRRESRFSTWLTRIAANEALGRLRKRGEQKQVSLDEHVDMGGEKSMPREIEDRAANPEEHYRRIEMQAILSKAIGNLEPTLRPVFVLRDVQDLSTKATARLLGLSVPAVKTRLLRARLRLRERLSQWLGPGPVFAAR